MKKSTTVAPKAKKTYSKPELNVFGHVKNLTLDAGSVDLDFATLMGMAM